MSTYTVGQVVYFQKHMDVLKGTVVHVTETGQCTLKAGSRNFRFSKAGREIGHDYHVASILYDQAKGPEEHKAAQVRMALRRKQNQICDLGNLIADQSRREDQTELRAAVELLMELTAPPVLQTETQ